MNWVMYCSHDDIRAKLDQTADTWIGACFFAKNIMKFLRGLLCFFFEKTGSRDFKKSIIVKFNGLAGVFAVARTCMGTIS